MLDDRASITSAYGRWIRIALILALAVGCWLARMSPPRVSAALELDPSYQQALGEALVSGLRFGREIVFTSGPLAYFTDSPFDPRLYGAKLWLWEGLLGALVAGLLAWRLVRRGTGTDIALGALVLIVMPLAEDTWLFAMGLLAADVGLGTMVAGSPAGAGWRRILCGALALLLLSILTLIKVSSMTLAFAALAILLLRAVSCGGLKLALAWLLSFVAIQSLVFVGIGQRLADLYAYFSSSLELASGFDLAMSLPARQSQLFLAAAGLVTGLGLCVLHMRSANGEPRRERISSARAQALMVAVALLLAYKAGFTRVDNHVATFFGTLLLVPVFLIEFHSLPAAKARGLWRWRAAAVVVAALCATAGRPEDSRSMGWVVGSCSRAIKTSIRWISEPELARERLMKFRAGLQQQFELPRISAIVGERSISAFATGDGVLLLQGFHWKPRPIFQSFSVLTRRSATENARFLSGDGAPEFMLLRAGTIDRRLPSSGDPLSLQVLLRDYRPRANEGGFLLLERAPRSKPPDRAIRAQGDVGWNERLQVPLDAGPLVLQASVKRSVFGRLRAALYQSPEVFVEVELASGARTTWRIAPFALESGVALRPWLPTNEAWLGAEFGLPANQVVALRFGTPNAAAYRSRIPYEFQAAPDLRAPELDATRARELVLGAAGELPLRFESDRAPELTGWEGVPGMLLVHGPAKFVFAAAPGSAQLSARLRVPTWIASAVDFPGVEVIVSAQAGGAERELMRVELKGALALEDLELRLESQFETPGEIRLELRPMPGGDPLLASVAIREMRVHGPAGR